MPSSLHYYSCPDPVHYIIIHVQTRFTEERVKMYELLEQRKEEYDCLKTHQASEIEEYQEKLSQIEQVGHVTYSTALHTNHMTCHMI